MSENNALAFLSTIVFRSRAAEIVNSDMIYNELKKGGRDKISAALSYAL